MKVALSKHGCAHALSTAAYELDELSDSQRVANEKIYGSLLGDKGCLRKQPSLRSQLMRMLEGSPRVQLHGGRLFVLFRQGLPFIPVAPEIFDAIRLQYNHG